MPKNLGLGELRTKHIGTKITIHGDVFGVSQVRPSIDAIVWECNECGNEVSGKVVDILPTPYCACGNRKKTRFRVKDRKLIDSRFFWIGNELKGRENRVVKVILNGKKSSKWQIPEYHTVVATGKLETQYIRGRIVWTLDPDNLEFIERPMLRDLLDVPPIGMPGDRVV